MNACSAVQAQVLLLLVLLLLLSLLLLMLLQALNDRLQQRAQQRQHMLLQGHLLSAGQGELGSNPPQYSCDTAPACIGANLQELQAASATARSPQHALERCDTGDKASTADTAWSVAPSSTADVRVFSNASTATDANSAACVNAAGEAWDAPTAANTAAAAAEDASCWSECSSAGVQWDAPLLASAAELSAPSSAAFSGPTSTQAAAAAAVSAHDVHTPAAPGGLRQSAPELWKQQLHDERQQELDKKHQAARAAATAAAQRAASQRAAAWHEAQQQLPFKSAPSRVAGIQHQLHKTLSSVIRNAGPAAAAAAATAAAATAQAAAERAAATAAAAKAVGAASVSTARATGVSAAVVEARWQGLSNGVVKATTTLPPAVVSAVEVVAAPANPVQADTKAHQTAAEAVSSNAKPAPLSFMEMHLRQQQQKQQQSAATAAADRTQSASSSDIPGHRIGSGATCRHGSSSWGDVLSAGPALSTPRLHSNTAASSPKASRAATAGGAPAAAAAGAAAAAANAAPCATASSRRAGCAVSPRSKAAAWAAADAATDAEVHNYLRDHWQHQHLPAAALVLQCAWRARGPRLDFNK